MQPKTLLVGLLCVLGSPTLGVAQELPDHIRLIHPPASEPLPVVAWASGCSGFFHPRAPWHFVERAQHLLSEGYAVAYVDYLAASGHEAACGGELGLPEVGRVLSDAVRILAARPEIDSSHIVLLGGSLGGGGVLAALSDSEGESPMPAAALVLYPTCTGGTPDPGRIAARP